ncbi:hypothetical protein GCM10009654_66400 [Streptomyces hebeiensis]|uniref:Uncharacterized protein n=1 Tax=Streptomyces hebeiensis TaxID=229486 RepID=A0ABN1V958_9ACTN
MCAAGAVRGEGPRGRNGVLATPERTRIARQEPPAREAGIGERGGGPDIEGPDVGEGRNAEGRDAPRPRWGQDRARARARRPRAPATPAQNAWDAGGG